MKSSQDGSRESGSRSAILGQQRSHLLFVLSNAETGRASEFLDWYTHRYRRSLLEHPSVLTVRHYERDATDITQGRHAPVPFTHLGICEISVDGARQAQGIIQSVATLHQESGVAQAPATWLYYPLGEKVGASPGVQAPMLAVAFANSVPGAEEEFREWYVTRHIRHALSLPALISGQCFARAQFQMPGAMPSAFSMIALYEQVGSPQALLAEIGALAEGALDFPALNLSTEAFAESIYRSCVA